MFRGQIFRMNTFLCSMTAAGDGSLGCLPTYCWVVRLKTSPHLVMKVRVINFFRELYGHRQPNGRGLDYKTGENRHHLWGHGSTASFQIYQIDPTGCNLRISGLLSASDPHKNRTAGAVWAHLGFTVSPDWQFSLTLGGFNVSNFYSH